MTLFEAKASVGRKFLVAGRGGLNISNAENQEQFVARYSRGPWKELIHGFDVGALRHWAATLGCETFVATTGRIYPESLKAAPLLRAWVHRLRAVGVDFRTHHRWVSLQPGKPLQLRFDVGSFEADAAIFALGGASWPQTGSNGEWMTAFSDLGIALHPLAPANCGWELNWPASFLAKAEGLPLKNVALSCGNERAEGELLITRYGLEGGAIYKLGAQLRSMKDPALTLDLKPSSTVEQLLKRAAQESGRGIPKAWRLGPAATALVEDRIPCLGLESMAALVKAFPLALSGPRPIAEAISSAGGVCWESLDHNLMLKNVPGVFLAGEMVDWEAPTGGYLMHGCLATGAHAARGALGFVRAL